MTDDLEQVLARHLRTAAKEFHPMADAESIHSSIRQRLVLRRRRRTAGLMASVAVMVSLFVVVASSSAARPAGIRVRSAASTAQSDPPSTPTATRPTTTSCSPSCPPPSSPSRQAQSPSSPTSLTRPPSTYPPASDLQDTSPPGTMPAPPATNPQVSNSLPPDTVATTTPTSVVAPVTTFPVTEITTTTSVPGPTTTVPPVRVFTVADNKGRFAISLGTVVVIRLAGCVAATWTSPTSSNPAAVAPDGQPAPTSAGMIEAQFSAVGYGPAVIRASSDAAAACSSATGASFTLYLRVIG